MLLAAHTLQDVASADAPPAAAGNSSQTTFL